MIEKINENLELVKSFSIQSKEEAEAFRIKYLGKKGILNDFFTQFKAVPSAEKKDYGLALNLLKKAVTEKVKAFQSETETSSQGSLGDLSLIHI